MIGLPVTPNYGMGLHQDGPASLRTCDEIDRDLAPLRSPCTRILPSRSPGSMGNAWHPQAESGAGAIMRDESAMDITNSTPGSQGDRAGDQGETLATIQGVQADSPLVRGASLDDNEGNKHSEESQAAGPPSLRPQSRLIKQSKDPLTSTRSLRPRPNAGSNRPERLPSVSVVIPTRQTGQSMASTKTKHSAGARRYGHWGGSDTGNPNDDQATQASMEDYSPFPGRSSPKARGRPRKRPKRGTRNNSTSTNIVGGFTSRSQNRSNGGSAVTPGKTQEIFGRGVLRIQSHGPRNAYFMTFLPEVTQHPSPPSPSKMPPDQSSHAGDTSEDESLQPVGRGRPHKRTVPTACEDGDVRSTRHSTKSSKSRSRNYRHEAQRKPRRRLPWSSDEVDFLLKLRRDEGRPWSEVARLFLDRYPGRSPGSIQVYWSTAIKKAKRNMAIGGAT